MALTHGLWAPDEPRYAEVAREIFEGGGPLVMHRCGEVYPDKPPLFFWLIGLVGSLTGWSAAAMRLVSIASVAGMAALTAGFARRWWGAAEAAWAPWILLGMALVAWLGSRLQIDPLLGVLCIGALYVATGEATRGAQASRRALLAGLLVGLALLAKGPVALVVVGGVLLAWRLLDPRPRAARASSLAVLAASVLALAPAVTWAELAALSEPRLFDQLFFGQHLGRVLEGRAHHGPPWQHLLQMPAFLLPWTLPVLLGIGAAWSAWRARKRGDSGHDAGLLRAAAWLLVLFVFFSAIPTKRELYLLPAYPAAALLAARWLVLALRAERLPRLVTWFSVGLLALLGLALPAAGFVARRLAPGVADVRLGTVLAALPFLVGAALAAHALRAGRVAGWARRVSLTWAVGLTLTALGVLPAVDGLKSARTLAARIAGLPQHPHRIPCYGVQPEGYRFYTGLPFVLGGHAGGPERELEALLREDGEQSMALLEDDVWARLGDEQRAHLGYRVALEGRVGSKRVVVLVAALPGQAQGQARAAAR